MTGAFLSDSLMPLDSIVRRTELLAASTMELTGMSSSSEGAGSHKVCDRLDAGALSVDWVYLAFGSA